MLRPVRPPGFGPSLRRGSILAGLLALGTAAAACSGAGGREAGTVLVVAQEARSPSEAGVRSRLVVLDAGTKGDARPLTRDFHAVRAPAVSPDGRRVVFVGRRSAENSWELWEKGISGGSARRISWAGDRPDQPAYLADGRVVFSGRPPGGDDGTPRALFAVDPDGGDARRITFHPVPDRWPTVLPDGRVLFVSGEPGDERLMTVRSDGTGMRLFYSAAGEGGRMLRPRAAPEDSVVFVQTTGGRSSAGALVSVSARHPASSRRERSAGVPGAFRSAAPLPSGEWAVIHASPDSGERSELRRLAPSRGRLEGELLRDSGFVEVEVAAPPAGPDPKSFVSVVDTTAGTGKMFCVDAGVSSRPPRTGSAAVAVRVSTPDGPLGRIPLESDGSFFVELPADTPVRFATVDGTGDTVRGPSDWVWVRPNESRGCVGCHEGRQRTPPNRVPLAVEGEPVVPNSGGRIAGPGSGAESGGEGP